MASPKNSLLEGPILRSLLTLAVPIVAANILQSAYQIIDAFWVGRLGGAAVAAVLVSFPALFLMFAIGGGLLMCYLEWLGQKGRSPQARAFVDGYFKLLVLISFVVGALTGVVALQLILNVMTFAHVPGVWYPLLNGIIILAALIISLFSSGEAQD